MTENPVAALLFILLIAVFVLPFNIGQILLGFVWIWLSAKHAKSKKTDAIISVIYILATLAVGLFLALKLEDHYIQYSKFIDFRLINTCLVVSCVTVGSVYKSSATTIRMVAVLSCLIVMLSTIIGTVEISNNTYTLAESIAYIFQYSTFCVYMRILYLPDDNTPPEDRKKDKATNKKWFWINNPA
jgi:hypothetical protein